MTEEYSQGIVCLSKAKHTVRLNRLIQNDIKNLSCQFAVNTIFMTDLTNKMHILVGSRLVEMYHIQKTNHNTASLSGFICGEFISFR